MQYKISDVIKILKKEYPDLSASALRYWDKLGIVSPSEKTEGGHRKYSDKDLENIRFVKEMSLINYPIDDIKKMIESSRGNADAVLRNRKMIGLARSIRLAKEKMEEFDRLDNTHIFEYVYSRESFLKLFKTPVDDLIKKARNFNIIHPRMIDGREFFNKMDERIIRSFVEGGEDLIDKCQDLYSAVAFFKKNFELSAFLIVPFIQGILSMMKVNMENMDSELRYPQMAHVGYVFINEVMYWEELNK